jgi:hypothetical protein
MYNSLPEERKSTSCTIISNFIVQIKSYYYGMFTMYQNQSCGKLQVMPANRLNLAVTNINGFIVGQHD